jgi:hypothetical protein
MRVAINRSNLAIELLPPRTACPIRLRAWPTAGDGAGEDWARLSTSDNRATRRCRMPRVLASDYTVSRAERYERIERPQKAFE